MAATKVMLRNFLARGFGLRLTVNHQCCCSKNLHSRGIATKNIAPTNQIYSNNFTKPPQQHLQLSWVVCKRFLASKARRQKAISNKNEGPKPDLKLGSEVLYHELPIIFVNATYNNTMFTITDHNGRTVDWTSAGAVGFKGAKRGTNHAAQTAGEAASKKAISLGISRVRVKIRGMGPGRQTSVKGLIAGGTEIVSITDVTPIPHNGCRPPKQRRI